jgi:hypothetical protein
VTFQYALCTQEQAGFDNWLEGELASNPEIARIPLLPLAQLAGCPIIQIVADVTFIGQKVVDLPFRPRLSIGSQDTARVQPPRDFRLWLPLKHKQTKNLSHQLDFVWGSWSKNNPISFEVLALTILQNAFRAPVLIKQLSTQSITWSAA